MTNLIDLIDVLDVGNFGGLSNIGHVDPTPLGLDKQWLKEWDLSFTSLLLKQVKELVSKQGAD